MSSATPAGTPADKPARSATRSKQGRRTRAEKTQETRSRLMHSAAQIIGEEGYAKATVSKITARADLSLGSFYTYFENREDLFSQLLPLMGEEMLAYIRARVQSAEGVVSQEETGLKAFFEFMGENPGFYRLLNEAETEAPLGYQRHFANLTRRYVRALSRGWKKGELPGYDEDELETIVYILMSARNYLTMRYRRQAADEVDIDRIISTYVKFISGGLLYGRGNGQSS